ncbi:MAG: hypothetical protein JWM37_920 [Candidatus Saccharibacteria bacterium]|nr:hypothetical protein [Candidatus Saccharibacteria bacterium]
MVKLNETGVLHWSMILPILTVVAIGLIGARILGGSQAATAVTNGNIYFDRNVAYKSDLTTKTSQLTFPAAFTNCNNTGTAYMGVNQTGKTVAAVCKDSANAMKKLTTYPTTSTTGIKQIATVPAAFWAGQPRWQKAKVGTQNLQILTREFDTTRSIWVFVQYDSVTGARKLVKVGGTDNFVGTYNSVNYDWSADGKKILYVAVDSNNAATTKQIKMTSCAVDISLTAPTKTCGATITVSGAVVGLVSWSYASDKVSFTTLSTAYSAENAKVTTALFTANANLTGIKKLTTTPAGQTFYAAVWSPDSQSLVVSVRNIAKTPSNGWMQIRSASTGAVTKQVADDAGLFGAILKWMPV